MIRLLLTLALALVPALASAQLFTMDLGSGAFPMAGFNEEKTEEYGIVVNRTREATAGPDGTPVYRFTFLYDASQMNAGDAYGGEHYLGWVANTTVPTSGQSRFGRIIFRVSSSSNFRAVNSSNGSASQIIHKLVIVGDGAPGRTIVSIHGDVASGTFQMQIGKDGEGTLKFDGLQRNVWYYTQWETVTGNGGLLKAWVNNNSYGSPSATSGSLNMGVAQYFLFLVGFYNNRMVASDGVHVVDFAGAEYATTFANDWYPGEAPSATVPDPPTIGTATAGNGQASVAFTPPGDDGGAAITGYTATSSPGGLTGTCASSPCTVTGLNNGTPYTFTVTATNSEGDSDPSSASNSVTPSAPVSVPVRLRIRGG